MMCPRDNALLWSCRRSTISLSLKVSSYENLESLFVSNVCGSHLATGLTEQPPHLAGSGCDSGNQDLQVFVGCRAVCAHAERPFSQEGREEWYYFLWTTTVKNYPSSSFKCEPDKWYLTEVAICSSAAGGMLYAIWVLYSNHCREKHKG